MDIDEYRRNKAVTLGGFPLALQGGEIDNATSLQERLDNRRMRAERELISITELQTLLNSLPDGMTHGQLSQLVNL